MLIRNVLVCLLSLSSSFCYGRTAIHQFTNTNQSTEICVATDNRDNFIALFQNKDLIESSYGDFLSGNSWGRNQVLSDPDAIASEPSLAIDSTGMGLAIWIEKKEETYSVKSSLYITTFAILEKSTDLLTTPYVCMNDFSKGLAVWRNDRLKEIHASFFSNGSWTPFQVIGKGNIQVVPAYSPNGTAAVIWSLYDHQRMKSSIFVNSFNGTTWQSPILLDSQGWALFNNSVSIGMDAYGNAIAIWAGYSDGKPPRITSSRFDGSVWSSPQVLSDPIFSNAPSCAVALDGTAIVVWSISGKIQMRQFDGTSWKDTLDIAENGNRPKVTLNRTGDALITWISHQHDSDQLFARVVTKDGRIGSPIQIATCPVNADFGAVGIAFSNRSNLGAFTWSQDTGEPLWGGDTFGSVMKLPKKD